MLETGSFMMRKSQVGTNLDLVEISANYIEEKPKQKLIMRV